MRPVLWFASASFTASLAGCCAFVPCHPGTSVLGTVLEAQSHAPIPGATVGLFGSKLASSSTGCFKLHLASALPLTLTASAPGYKSVEVPANFGSQKVTILLVPQSSSSSSSVTWQATSEAEVRNATCNA
jgi:hypothetical protein